MSKVFENEKYMIKIVEMFTDVVEVLHFELYDVLVIETEFLSEMNELLKIADNILLGIPIVVACGEDGLRVENGNNSKFYFLNKFAGAEEWKRVIQMAVSENYIINIKKI